MWQQEKMKECEDCLSTLREDFKQLEEEFNKMKSEEVDVKNDLEKCDVNVKENEAKIKYWKKEVWKVAVHIVRIYTVYTQIFSYCLFFTVFACKQKLINYANACD